MMVNPTHLLRVLNKKPRGYKSVPPNPREIWVLLMSPSFSDLAIIHLPRFNDFKSLSQERIQKRRF